MNVTIEADQLRPFIGAFYEFSGIKIAIYDNCFKEVLTYPEKRSDFCSMLEYNPLLKAKCDACTARLCRECADTNRTIVYKCHAGLTEVVAPLSEHGVTIGYVIYGQITNQEDRDVFISDVLKRCAAYELDVEEMSEKLKSIKYYSNAQLESTLKIINALASYIILKKWIYLSDKPLALKLIEYIDGHLAEDLSVPALCKKFAISKSELYQCTTEYMSEGIAKYVRRRRVEAAMEMIRRNKDKPLWKVAEEIGFKNYEYFLRVFKADTGISATALRRGTSEKNG